MASSNQQRFTFPQIGRVRLHSFSLYSLQPNISLEFKRGVLCLAGANGIGKSTFLSTLNYGLTGAVPNPDRRLLSAQAYLHAAVEYSKTFFDGRISENDRDNAAITVEFQIGKTRYEITRGLFDSNDVRHLKINGVVDAGLKGTVTPLARANLYRERITAAIGLNSFEQFVFLQHFIFTFDEARNLLFWNQAATSQALFLCFGGDPQDAQKADALGREAEKAGSRGRNAQFQVNNTRKRIDYIQSSISNPSKRPANGDDLDARYQALQDEIEKAAALYERSETMLSEADLRVVESSAEVARLRSAYADSFNRFMHGSSNPIAHPLIARSLQDGVCAVCDSEGQSVVNAIKGQLDTHKCPLCKSPIKRDRAATQKDKDQLASLDKELSKARSRLDEHTKAQARLRGEVEICQTALTAARKAANAFEEKNNDAVEFLKAQQTIRSGPIASTLSALQQAMTEFTTVRDEAYAERDTFRNALKELQRGVEIRWARAEKTFVPKFRQLAELFIGIDLDISLQLTAPAGLKLIVELRGSQRSEEDQLSESQRFFVDIALRMALAKQMAKDHTRTCLLIDTPEGSLDIAYEDRAGEMFAEFIHGGHDLVMTSNINSSRLLKTLAKLCGTKSMSLQVMTGWSELSDVQQKANALFGGAIKDIGKALELGPAA